MGHTSFGDLGPDLTAELITHALDVKPNLDVKHIS